VESTSFDSEQEQETEVEVEQERESEQELQQKIVYSREEEELRPWPVSILTNQVGDVSQAEIELRSLEREADANRKLYESFLTRSKEARVQQEIQQPDARILSYAQVPGGPSYPPKQRYINFSIVGSLALALVLVAYSCLAHRIRNFHWLFEPNWPFAGAFLIRRR